MNHNIWEEALSYTRNRTAIYSKHSSYGSMKDCIRANDAQAFAEILSHLHNSIKLKLDEHTYEELLKTAASSGSVECFEYLQPHVSKPIVYADALNSAAENGHLTMVQHIASLVGEYDKEEALCMAVLYNRVDVVHYLLPLCNPKNKSSKFLAAASAERHTDLFELLYPLSNPENALGYLQSTFANQPESWEMLEQRILHDKLLAVTPQECNSKRSKI